MLFQKKHKLEFPTADEALPGRDERDASSRAPRRAREPTRPAVSGRVRAGRLRHGLLLGGRAQVLAGARRLHDCSRLRGRLTRPTRATRRSARGGPATPRPCSSSSTRRRRATRRCSASSGRATIRPRACARGTTSARSTARRSTGSNEAQREAAEASRASFQEALCEGGSRRDHDGARRGGPVLLRRALPPAVPREEPARLLRPRRHRRRLPGGRRRRLPAGVGAGSHPARRLQAGASSRPEGPRPGRMRCGPYADQLLASVLIPWRLPRVAHGAILARLSGQSGRAEPGVRDDRGAGCPDRASRGDRRGRAP